MLVFYTDGACKGNPGPGGFGVVSLQDNEILYDYSEYCDDTTNNREEMKAILWALNKYGSLGFEVPVVYSDSAYSVNTFNNWMFGWQRNGWVKSDRKTPENLDLVKEYYNSLKKIDLRHIKGHAGHEYNEIADKLATGKMKVEEII